MINRKADGGLELPAKIVQLGHSSILVTLDTYGHLFPRGDDGPNWRQQSERCWGETKMSDAYGGQWLVEFKGRNHSGYYDQNFLWRHNSVYVMDNHRAAMWCWLQRVNPRTPHSIFHIDRHFDTIQSNLEIWRKNLPKEWDDLTIDQYLDHTFSKGSKQIPLFSWDNYLSIYFDTFGRNVHRSFFATHNDGDEPNHHSVQNCSPWELPENLDFWINKKYAPWIMNIDLDYFFWHEHDDDRMCGQMLSDEYIRQLCVAIRHLMDDKIIAVTTIALTPDKGLTGGWEPAEQMMELVLCHLGIEFKLPTGL